MNMDINRFTAEEARVVFKKCNLENKYIDIINSVYDSLYTNIRRHLNYVVIRKDRCSLSYWKVISSDEAFDEFVSAGYKVERYIEHPGEEFVMISFD